MRSTRVSSPSSSVCPAGAGLIILGSPCGEGETSRAVWPNFRVEFSHRHLYSRYIAIYIISNNKIRNFVVMILYSRYKRQGG